MSRKGSPMNAIAIQMERLTMLLRGFGRTDPEELRHAAQVSLWVRWFVMVLLPPGGQLPGGVRRPQPYPEQLATSSGSWR